MAKKLYLLKGTSSNAYNHKYHLYGVYTSFKKAKEQFDIIIKQLFDYVEELEESEYGDEHSWAFVYNNTIYRYIIKEIEQNKDYTL